MPTTTDISELWILEWSEEEKYFHIEKANTKLNDNIGDFLGGLESGYSVIGIFKTPEEADIQLKKLCAQRGLVFDTSNNCYVDHNQSR